MTGKDLMGIGAFLGALAVAIGAFGAHLFIDLMTPDELERYKTGVLYHLTHAIVIVFCGYMYRRSPKKKPIKWAGIFMIFGIFLFAFSMYAYALSKSAFFTFLMPVGGLSFISGWISIMVGSLKSY